MHLQRCSGLDRRNSAAKLSKLKLFSAHGSWSQLPGHVTCRRRNSKSLKTRSLICLGCHLGCPRRCGQFRIFFELKAHRIRHLLKMTTDPKSPAFFKIEAQLHNEEMPFAHSYRSLIFHFVNNKRILKKKNYNEWRLYSTKWKRKESEEEGGERGRKGESMRKN